MRPHRVEDRRQVPGSVGRGIWLLVGLAGALAYVSKGSGSPLRTPQDSMAPFAFSAPAGSGYAGASACASCHRAIYEKFRRTGMGRSMAPVTSAQLQTVGASASIRDEKWSDILRSMLVMGSSIKANIKPVPMARKYSARPTRSSGSSEQEPTGLAQS